MKRKTKLGMGLDLLLTANSSGNDKQQNKQDLSQAKLLFAQAVIEDENARIFEAYYLYHRVVDILEPQQALAEHELLLMISQAYNNMSVILYENEEERTALEYLKKAVTACPENKTARENLEQISRNLP